jgi:hypothetical protein
VDRCTLKNPLVIFASPFCAVLANILAFLELMVVVLDPYRGPKGILGSFAVKSSLKEKIVAH